MVLASRLRCDGLDRNSEWAATLRAGVAQPRMMMVTAPWLNINGLFALWFSDSDSVGEISMASSQRLSQAAQ